MSTLSTYGQSLIGKTAQSNLLTEIGINGEKSICQPQVITGYEIVTEFQEDALMVHIGGETVYEETLFNISRYPVGLIK